MMMKRITKYFLIFLTVIAFSTCSSYAASNDKIRDAVYPVGSFIETTDASFDPNTSWGGVWRLETPGLVHVSAGENYLVSGANATNGTLVGVQDGGTTDNIVPLHKHNVPSRGASLGGGPSHNHSYSWYNHGCIPNGGGGWSNLTYGSGDRTGDFSTSANGAHSHTSTVAAVTSGSTGEETVTNSNMMPYKCVYRWKRIS